MLTAEDFVKPTAAERASADQRSAWKSG